VFLNGCHPFWGENAHNGFLFRLHSFRYEVLRKTVPGVKSFFDFPGLLDTETTFPSRMNGCHLLNFASPWHLGVHGIHEIGTSVDFTNVVKKQLFAGAPDRRDFYHGGHPVTGLDLGLEGLDELGDAMLYGTERRWGG